MLKALGERADLRGDQTKQEGRPTLRVLLIETEIWYYINYGCMYLNRTDITKRAQEPGTTLWFQVSTIDIYDSQLIIVNLLHPCGHSRAHTTRPNIALQITAPFNGDLCLRMILVCRNEAINITHSCWAVPYDLGDLRRCDALKRHQSIMNVRQLQDPSVCTLLWAIDF